MHLLNRLLKRRRPRVAMVMCIRNEARFLEANLRYHRAVGIERAYVFLDRCDDGSDQIAASLPWVRVTRLDPRDTVRFKHVPDMQVVCMDRALSLAREEGFDWLLVLDADEFASPSLNHGDPSREPEDFPSLLSRVKRSVEVVWLRPHESLPQAAEPHIPFWQQHYFQVDSTYAREALDPTDGTIKTWQGLAGHTVGKSMVRTSTNVQALGAHGWTRFQGVTYPRMPARTTLKSIDAGCLLHYMIVDWRQWLDKYRKLSHQPPTYRFGGAVEFPKQAWTTASRHMNEDEARAYYQRWVAVSQETLDEMSAAGVVRNCDVVERVLNAKDADDAAPKPPMAPHPIATWSMPPEMWRDAETFGRTDLADGTVQFHVTELARDRLQGVDPPKYDGRRTYCGMQPRASIRLKLQPADYLMSFRLRRGSPRQHSLAVTVDGTRLAPSRYTVSRGRAMVRVSVDDFADGDEHLFAFELTPAKESQRHARPVRSTEIVDLFFQPISLSQAAA